MSNHLALKLSEYALEIPQDTISIVVWVLWLAAIIYFTIRYRGSDFKINRRILIWLAILSLSVLVLTPFLNVPINPNDSDADTQQLMLFVAVPWLVAGGMLGMVPAVLVGGMSGLLAAYLYPHDIYTPLIFMTTSLVFCLSVRQRYRTFFFRFLRFPLFAALFSVLVALPFQFAASLLTSSGEAELRMVAAITDLPGAVLSFGGMVLIGGVICVIFKLTARKIWGVQESLVPAPGETSLRFRVIVIIIPLLLALSVILTFSTWNAAEDSARDAAVDQLTTTAKVASEGLSAFVETGESLIARFVKDERLADQNSETVSQLLVQKAAFIPYFDQLLVTNPTGEIIAASPSENSLDLPLEMDMGLLAQSSVDGIMLFSSPGTSGGSGFIANFVTGISDSSDTIVRFLWGRTAFDGNIYTAPVVEALAEFEDYGGNGLIVGSDDAVLFQTDHENPAAAYTGGNYPTATFFEGQSADGMSVLQYYQQVGDTQWVVVTSLPSQTVQASAWQAAHPVLLLGVVGTFIVFLVMLIVLSPVDKSLKQLETTANNAALGQYDAEGLTDGSAGALSALKDAFRRMILSFQKNKQNDIDLLELSDRTAKQLTLKESLQLILIAALEHGAASARILITDGAAANKSSETRYHAGLGDKTGMMELLDRDVLALTRVRGALTLQGSQIDKLVADKKGMSSPASLIAVPLEWKNARMGVLWAAYHDQQYPRKEEVDFFKRLSEKASFAIINAQAVGESLETTSQFEKILDSLKDPVLISDNLGRIIFLNEAAQALIGTEEGKYIGRMASSVFHDENLLSLLQGAERESRSMEVQLSNGKTYFVAASPAQVEDRQMGVVALFKDVSQYKMQDALKTEFVTTASHELRSPLTLIHGYAKILRLTGNLNEQQDAYVRNIVERVEEMRNLVQNLLDIGRLEAGVSMEIKKASVGEIINKVVEGLTAQSNQKNLHVAVSLPDAPLEIEGDVAFLTLAMRNLVDNAIKFTKMGGDVFVSAAAQDKSVVFKVQDTGIGIAPLDQRQIFNKFHSVSVQDGEGQQGSGLGLAIVKSIAERHGGKVWVESKLGKGSTFYMQIPGKQT